MASERARGALRLRRSGATFAEIAGTYRVSASRARQLVLAALRSEPGFRDSEEAREAALASARIGSRKRRT